MNNIAPITPIDSLLLDYRQYLVNNAGLTPSTCRIRLFHVRAFLNSQFKPKARQLDFQRITPQALLGHVLDQSERVCLQTVQSLASSLRSFCRFLCASGHVPLDLSPAIPRVASHGRDDFPTYLRDREVQRLLKAVKGATAAQKRNYAIMLCFARLGLRVGEVAHLDLEDIDWRAGTLRLTSTKGRRDRLLPLPTEVGRALADYLRRARPSSSSRRVFLSLNGGHPVTSNGIGAMTAKAMARVGIKSPRKGPHLLRHTLASHLVQKGAALKTVADLLGHASLSTTQVYAKVNLPLLRQVAAPWPKEVCS